MKARFLSGFGPDCLGYKRNTVSKADIVGVVFDFN